MTHKNTRIKLTLMEMLINLAVIAILAALLSPALTAVKRAQAPTIGETTAAIAPYVTAAPTAWRYPAGASVSGAGVVLGVLAAQVVDRLSSRKEKMDQR